jgi:hypothetical protein
VRLELRDWLAEICLAALTNSAAEETVRALARYAGEADPQGGTTSIGGAERRCLLGEKSPFEAAGAGIRLRPALLGGLAALRWRAERFEQAVEASCRCGRKPSHDPVAEPIAEEIAWALCAAGALFNLELFFEVHELLEPYWRRATGDLRQFLQGLIQVAVGLSHRANGNLRGAHALLDDGNAKLARFRPRVYGMELEEFSRAVAAVAERLGDADAPVALPRWTVERSQDSAITR